MLTNSEYTTKSIRNQLEQYIINNKLKSLVIGISGGVDSALCCALAKPVCDKLKIPLIGRSLPIETNKQDEIYRADLVGNVYCTEYEKNDLSIAFKKYIEFSNLILLDFSIKVKIRLGNYKARLRMIHLYDIAQENKGLVLSTDNLTEYYLGFWTLHGDVGDFGMIQGLWKHEVYQLSEHLMYTSYNEKERIALNKCINAIPTDGLGITDSDLDQLGSNSYDEVDMLLEDFINNGENEDCPNYTHPVIQRYINTKFKRNNPYNLKRETII